MKLHLPSLLLLLVLGCLLFALAGAAFDRITRELAGDLGPSLSSTLRASTVCVGFANIGSCNVRQSSTQDTHDPNGAAPDLAIAVLLILVALAASVVAMWMTVFGE